MKESINHLLVKAILPACLLCASCNDDNDYIAGTPNDAVAQWSVSNPSAHLTLLVDEMPAEGFFDADAYKGFQTTATIEKAADDKVSIQFADASFTDLFGLPATLSLGRGEDFAYASGTFEQPFTLSLRTPVSVGDYLPTLGGVLQGVISGLGGTAELPPAMVEYLKNFNILEQKVGDMTLEVSSYYFSVDLIHAATSVKGFVTLKTRIKDFKFYGADANLINQFMPMLVSSELFQGMNEFNLKVALDFKKQ